MMIVDDSEESRLLVRFFWYIIIMLYLKQVRYWSNWKILFWKTRTYILRFEIV